MFDRGIFAFFRNSAWIYSLQPGLPSQARISFLYRLNIHTCNLLYFIDIPRAFRQPCLSCWVRISWKYYGIRSPSKGNVATQHIQLIKKKGCPSQTQNMKRSTMSAKCIVEANGLFLHNYVNVKSSGECLPKRCVGIAENLGFQFDEVIIWLWRSIKENYFYIFAKFKCYTRLSTPYRRKSSLTSSLVCVDDVDKVLDESTYL